MSYREETGARSRVPLVQRSGHYLSEDACTENQGFPYPARSSALPIVTHNGHEGA